MGSTPTVPPQQPGLLAIGANFAGCVIEGVAGRGGMGVVYCAREVRPPRRVALKVISPDQAADPIFRERFERESDLAATIEHSNVLPVYRVGDEDGLLYRISTDTPVPGLDGAVSYQVFGSAEDASKAFRANTQAYVTPVNPEGISAPARCNKRPNFTSCEALAGRVVVDVFTSSQKDDAEPPAAAAADLLRTGITHLQPVQAANP